MTQWRFYYDPPEFQVEFKLKMILFPDYKIFNFIILLQCVMVDDLSKGYHIGYFRDDPNELPVFVGSNTESEGCVLTPMSDNLFSALRYVCMYLEKKIETR